MGQLPLMQMGYDAAQLMAQEYRSMTLRRRLAKIADLEAQLAADPLPGFHQVCSPFDTQGLQQLSFPMLWTSTIYQSIIELSVGLLHKCDMVQRITHHVDHVVVLLLC